MARCIGFAHMPGSHLPPIDQNCAMFYGRYVIDEGYGGLAFEDEAQRCAELLTDPKIRVLIMGNHGVMVIGETVADTFNQLYYFERAAETYIRALQTGQPLRVLSHEIAQRTSDQIAAYPSQADRHMAELKAILDEEGATYAQ